MLGTLKGKLRGVCCEYVDEKWSCLNGNGMAL